MVYQLSEHPLEAEFQWTHWEILIKSIYEAVQHLQNW